MVAAFFVGPIPLIFGRQPVCVLACQRLSNRLLPGGRSKCVVRGLKSTSGWFAAAAWSAATALLVCAAAAQGPLAAKVKITPAAVYTGSSPPPKPQKILAYDFAVNPDFVGLPGLSRLLGEVKATAANKFLR
jgi:hypothetical protein